MTTKLEVLAIILGKVAWETYKEAVGGKAFNGDPLPTFEQMQADPSKAKIVQAWKDAAREAVITYLETKP